MDYRFNYGFLSKYIKEFHLSKRDVLSALGTQDYTSLNRWIKGETPLHVNAMLRFCNYYNVPLKNFFFDYDGVPSDFSPDMPGENDITSATRNISGRRNSISNVQVDTRHPLSPEQREAIDSGMRTRVEQLRIREDIINRVKLYDHDGPEYADQLNEPLTMVVSDGRTTASAELDKKLALLELQQELEAKHQQRVDQLHARFEQERSRLLSIIEGLQQELSRSTSK